MNLKNKKKLASRTFGVGTDRLIFRNDRIDEIKEAITKQDMRDLMSSGAIMIKEAHGRKKADRRKRKRGPGKIKKKVGARKKDYMNLTRKLRAFSRQLMLQGKINKNEHENIRKKIRSSIFKSKAHMSEIVRGVKPAVKKINKEKNSK